MQGVGAPVFLEGFGERGGAPGTRFAALHHVHIVKALTHPLGIQLLRRITGSFRSGFLDNFRPHLYDTLTIL